ncbi:MAG TPA: DinB family protein [Terriglobales bacterium]|nr:DinB family protein [Terriglobales bacterium]
MPLPALVETLWNDLQSVRARLLKEIEGVSQAQADWRTSDKDWSIGEIVHHLTLAEIGTGKVTSKVLKDAGDTVKPFPAGLKGFTPLATPSGGRAEAPPAVWPERGRPLAELVGDMKAARERSRQSIERLGAVDPRPLTFPHPRLGPLDLAQWWMLQAWHDGIHLEQLRGVKAEPGFPTA